MKNPIQFGLALVLTLQFTIGCDSADPTLIEPGTFSNVDNGFGFVGAGYELFLLWEPSDGVLRHSGFHVEDSN